MTILDIRSLENSRASDNISLPDVTSRASVLVIDADGINGSWYFESTPNTPVPDDQESTVKPLVSYANEPWY